MAVAVLGLLLHAAPSYAFTPPQARLLRLRGGERTFAMLKPDVASDVRVVGEIKELISAAGLTIERERTCTLPRSLCRRFYAEHRKRPFYDTLVAYVSSAPVLMLELSGDGAVLAWRTLLGPTNSAKARAEAPRSIRALYGTDGSRNAAHGSDSAASAARELTLMFDRPRLGLTPRVVATFFAAALAALKAAGRLPRRKGQGA